MSNSNNNSYITLSDLWEIFIGNIWLFVVSIIICLSAAVAYIVVTPPTYTRSASILMKDDSSNSGINSEIFASLGLEGAKTEINDEIFVFTTPKLMEEVVNRLSLDEIYKMKYRDLRWIDIYHSAPFNVVLDSDLEQHVVSFNLKMDGKGGYELTDLTINGGVLSSSTDGVFGQKIETPQGSFTIEYVAKVDLPISDDLYSYSKVSAKSLAVGYSSALSATLRAEKASVIVLSITMGSKEKAEDLLNTLIEVYSENWIQDKNAITVSTTEFIDERLQIIAAELGAVDEDISNYKSKNLLPDLSAVASMNLQTSNANFQRQIALNNQLSMAQYLSEYIQDNSSADKLLPVNSGIESTSINDQIAEYNQILMQKNALLANSSENNPIVADMTTNLKAMRSLLSLSIKELISTLELQLKNIVKEESNTKARISNNPTQELYLLSSSREQTVKEQLYLFLLQKREESQLNQAFTAYNTKVLDWARGSNAPVAPQRNVILLFGFAIGCILPIVFLILKESMNTTVNGREDLANISVPFLGSIPTIEVAKGGFLPSFGKKGSADSDVLHVIDNSRNVVSEAFRVVRTNLDFMSEGSKRCKLFTITSFNPKSGKSFISLNVALSMAMKNSRTLVVDCDLRRGSLSKAANSPRMGLVSYLNGKTENAQELICREQYHPMLDILPMGVMPPNPTELLLTDKFAALVNELQKSYDYIFFDCPPLEIVPDASIVEKFSDSTIFVARAGLLDKRLIPDIEELYNSKRLKNISLVLNGVQRGGGKYGYGKYGYGKYGYGKYGYGQYGYGTHEEDSEAKS